MKRPRLEKLLAALALIVLVAAIAWWYLGVEKTEQWTFDPASAELISQRHIMAERWLTQQQASTVRALGNLDSPYWYQQPSGLTLLLSQPDTLGDWQRNQLLQWVQQGGHLVAPAPRNLSDQAEPLNPYGISRCSACSPLRHPDYEAPQDDAIDDYDFALRKRQVMHAGDSYTLWLSGFLQPQDDLPSHLELSLDEHNMATFASYPLGQGRVTLMADADLFRNHRLVYADHARLLLTLAEGLAEDDAIYLQQRPIQAVLWSWLWHLAPGLWLAALLLLVLWLWPHLCRFGPIRQPDRSQSTQMQAHLMATARFDWRHNQSSELIEAMREQRNRRCQRHFPDWATLNHQQRCQRLQPLVSEVSPKQLQWLLNTREISRADELILYTQLHAKLMHAL